MFSSLDGQSFNTLPNTRLIAEIIQTFMSFVYIDPQTGIPGWIQTLIRKLANSRLWESKIALSMIKYADAFSGGGTETG